MSSVHFLRQSIDTARLPPTVVTKWSHAVLKEGFVPFPKRLLRCLADVFAGQTVAEDLAVVLSVVDFKRPNLSRLPSLDYLAFVAGLSPENFQSRLDDLEKRGLVSVNGNEEEMDIQLTGLLELVEQHAK